jgi:hypothetical protein
MARRTYEGHFSLRLAGEDPKQIVRALIAEMLEMKALARGSLQGCPPLSLPEVSCTGTPSLHSQVGAGDSPQRAQWS